MDNKVEIWSNIHGGTVVNIKVKHETVNEVCDSIQQNAKFKLKIFNESAKSVSMQTIGKSHRYFLKLMGVVGHERNTSSSFEDDWDDYKLNTLYIWDYHHIENSMNV